MFAPQSLPRVAEGERPLLRIASGTHYIERVTLAQGSDSLVRYELRPCNRSALDRVKELIAIKQPPDRSDAGLAAARLAEDP